MSDFLLKFNLAEVASWFWGGWDGLLYALTAFVVVGLITTVLLALSEQKFSSHINLRVLSQKIALFLLVGIGHIVDIYLAGGGNTFRTIIIWFYISYEGIALLRNIVALDLPVPKKLIKFLEQINHKADDTDENNLG